MDWARVVAAVSCGWVSRRISSSSFEVQQYCPGVVGCKTSQFPPLSIVAGRSNSWVPAEFLLESVPSLSLGASPLFPSWVSLSYAALQYICWLLAVHSHLGHQECISARSHHFSQRSLHPFHLSSPIISLAIRYIFPRSNVQYILTPDYSTLQTFPVSST